MKNYSTDKIRNVAFVGHGGVGKTTLAEALLLRSGAINRAGRVEDGTTVCDYEPEEKAHHLTLSLSVAPIEWKGYKINLIDTPGYPDFVGDVHAALRVVDMAVFVVSGAEGVQVQTEIIWKIASGLGIPRMVFVNKLDRERSDYDAALAQIGTVLGITLSPLELPIGAESAFHGLADILTQTAFDYSPSGVVTQGPLPEDLVARELAVHDSLVESIVMADDDLLEKFLGGEVPSPAELERTLARGVAAGVVFPVVCGSAITGVGIDRLADFICEIGPSPADRPGVNVHAGEVDVEVKPDPNGRPLAYVFKTIADPYVGHLSLFKVLSGTIHPDDHLINVTSGVDERLHGIFTLRGKEQQPAVQVSAGDIAAVAKLTDTHTGDTLAPRDQRVRADPIPTMAPVLTVAIKAKTLADDDKLGSALHRLHEEDPALIVDRDEQTHQTLLRGTGETHLAVALERLERKFGVKVGTEDVKVAYRETVLVAAEAEGRYKKQSGGHGQYGVANIKLLPGARGSGFKFIDAIVGGSIPRQFIPAVEKGIEERMHLGGVHGFPIVDIEVECFDGKYHPVDSSEMSFKMAGSLGLHEAMAKAQPIVLEPISLLRVTVPNAYQGDVMGDVNSRRGRVQGTEGANDGEVEVIAIVPTSETLRYAVDLRSMTGGRGRFTAVHDHYDILPAHLIEKVKKETGSAG